MDIEDWVISFAIAIVAVLGVGIATLARIGSVWRSASEEWAPDDVGGPGED